MISLQVGGFAAKAEWENESPGKTGNFRIIQILGIYSHIFVVEQNGKISWTCVKQSLFQPLNQKHVDFWTSEPVVEKHWLISGFMSSSCGTENKIVNKILQLLRAMNYHLWCKTVLWYLSLLTDTKETFCLRWATKLLFSVPTWNKRFWHLHSRGNKKMLELFHETPTVADEMERTVY